MKPSDLPPPKYAMDGDGKYFDATKMKTDDELIAEFMGGRRYVVGEERKHGYEPGKVIWYDLFDDPGTCTVLQFDTSWDWLMPVVEKIESLGSSFTIYTGGAQIFTKGTATGTLYAQGSKIETVYKAVVEFIRWYNTTPPPQTKQ